MPYEEILLRKSYIRRILIKVLFIIKKKENGLKCTITLETDDIELPLGITFKDTENAVKNKNMYETNLFLNV